MVKREANITMRWKAWAGDRPRLKKVFEVLDGHLEKRKGELLFELASTYPDLSPEDADKVDLPYVYVSRLREIQRKNLNATASEKELAQEVRGLPGEVLDDIDPQTIERLTVATPTDSAGGFYAKVEFDRSSGCRLFVSGEPDWVRLVSSSMKDVLKRGVPRWVRLRGELSGWVLGVVIYLALVAVYQLDDGAEERYGGGAVLAGVAAVILGGLAGIGAVRTLLPGFEIIEKNGDRSTGSKRLRILGSVLLAALLAGIGVWASLK